MSESFATFDGLHCLFSWSRSLTQKRSRPGFAQTLPIGYPDDMQRTVGDKNNPLMVSTEFRKVKKLLLRKWEADVLVNTHTQRNTKVPKTETEISRKTEEHLVGKKLPRKTLDQIM